MTFRSDRYEVEDILRSMTILVDTREQDTPRARKRLSALEVPYKRAVLDFGDYTYNAILPTGPLFDTSDRIKPLCAIERKMNLDELAECFTRGRKRFAAEMDRMQLAGGHMVLLVEDASWEMVLGGKYRSQFTPKAFLGSITAWMARYDLQVIMCDQISSGRLIHEILYRDLKERIERGQITWEKGEKDI